MKLYVFGEGETERRLMRQIIGKWFPNASSPEYRTAGKRELGQKVVDTLESDLFPDQQEAIRCIILRDLDADEGESLEGIRQGFTRLIQRMFEGYTQERVTFEPLSGYAHIFTYISKSRDLRIALHIAQSVGLKFGSATTDDYILAAAMIPSVAHRFAKEAGLVNGDALLRKVRQEFPRLMCDNMRPSVTADSGECQETSFLEAKDLLGAYLAFSRFPEKHNTLEQDVFAGIVVARAIRRAEHEAREIFDSLYQAVEWVVREG